MRTIIVISFLISSAMAWGHDGMRNCPEAQNSFKISTGEIIELPFCTDESEMTSLSAYGDIDKANQLLSKHGLYAVPVNDKAMYYLSFIRYGKSIVGQYKEVIFAVMASPEKQLSGGLMRFLEFFKFNLFGPPKTHVEVVLKIWVDNQKALIVGNEVWGFNKSMAQISLEPGHIELKDENGEMIVNGRWEKTLAAPIAFGNYFNFYAVTDKGVWAQAESQGHLLLNTMPSDSLSYGESPWGKILKGLNMEPSLKMVSPSYSMQIYQGLGSAL